MEDQEYDPAAYYEANKQRVDALFDEVEQINGRAADAHVTVYFPDETGEIKYILAFNRQSLDDYLVHVHNVLVTEDTPQADARNTWATAEARLLQNAGHTASYVLTRAQFMHEYVHAGDDDQTPYEPTYTQATVRQVHRFDDYARSVTYRTVDVEGLAGFGTGTFTQVEVSDGLVKQRLSFSRIGDGAPFIQYDTEPLNDELMRTLNVFLKEDQVVLIKEYMQGNFSDEAELEKALQDFVMSYFLIIPGDTLSKLIYDIRNRALLAKLENSMARGTANQPPPQKLDEFKLILETL